MSKSINQRRAEIQKNYRTKEHQEFFLKKRMEMLESYQNKASTENILNDISNRNNLQQSFEQLSRVVNGVNYFSDVMRLLQKGLVLVLMKCLKDGVEIKRVLQIISFMLEKMKSKQRGIDLYQRFYSEQILEVLLFLIGEGEVSIQCSSILYYFSENSEDYCLALAMGNGYKVLMDVFIARTKYSSDPQEDNKGSSNKFYSHILCILQNIVMMKQGTLQTQAQKLDIFRFIIDLLEAHLFLRQALGILYECFLSIGTNIGQSYIGLINVLLNDVQHPCRYQQNLLACIMLMSPHHAIDYNVLFMTGARVPKNQIHRLLADIMEKMVGEEFIAKIPISQDFWQKLLCNASSEEGTFKQLMLVAKKVKVNQDFMWRVSACTLQDCYSVVQQIFLLEILSQLTQESKDPARTAYLINKNGIVKKLERLLDSNNKKVRCHASDLLDSMLGPLAEQIELQKI